MKRRYTFSLLLLFISAALRVNAQDIKLDVDTAVSLALRNNLGLKSDRIDLITKKRAKQNSWNEFLPSVSLGAGLSGSGGSRPVSSSSPWDLSASITASLPLSAANIYSMKSTRLSYEAETISLEDTEKKLVRDVKAAFYNLIVLKQKISLIEQNIETAQKRYDQAKANYESGIISELTMLSAQVTLEALKPDLEEAAVDHEIAEMQFKQALGLDRDTPLSIEGSIEPKTLELEAGKLSQTHLENRLDIKALLKELEILETQKKLVGAEEYTPTLSLSYAFRAGVSDPFRADWGSAGSWNDSSTVGISLSLPLDGLIPGSSSRVKILEIDDSIEKNRIELVQKRELAEVEIETIVMRLKKSIRTSKALEQNVALAQKTYNLAENQYNAGVGGLMEVEDAYNALQEAKLGVLEERYNYLTGLFDLEYALNTRLDI
jgi:outer membrane protein TolC